MYNWVFKWEIPKSNGSYIYVYKASDEYDVAYSLAIRRMAEIEKKEFYRTIYFIIRKLCPSDQRAFINSLLPYNYLSLEETLTLTKIKNELL